MLRVLKTVKTVKNREKNINAILQKEDKFTDTCAVTMFGSLPSIFSITSSSAPVIQLARSHKSFNVRCFFFVWHKRTKACFANGSIFTTDKSSLFPDLKLEILPKFKRDKIRTGKSEVFRFSLPNVFHQKIPLKLDPFILFVFEILNFNYQQLHDSFKRNKKRIFSFETFFFFIFFQN